MLQVKEARVELRVVGPCPACKGDGYVLNPLWQKLENLLTEGFGPAWYKNGAPLETMAREVGWTEPIPPEEILCPLCEGKETVDLWLDIKHYNQLMEILQTADSTAIIERLLWLID